MMRRRLLLATAVTLALMPAVAVAQTSGTADITFEVVNVGTLEVLSGDVTCPGIQVGDTTVSAACTTPTWRARDFRGTGEGWHVTIAASNFTGPGGDTVAIATLTVTLATAGITRTSAGTACPDGCPTSLIGTTQPMSTAGLTVLTAASSDGLGEFSFAPAFVLTVPAGTPSGSYSSTMTATIISGPG